MEEKKVKRTVKASEPKSSVEIKIVPAPKKVQRKLSDVAAGDFFTMDKKRYQMRSFDGPTCRIVEMFTDHNGNEYGIALYDLPLDTKID